MGGEIVMKTIYNRRQHKTVRRRKGGRENTTSKNLPLFQASTEASGFSLLTCHVSTSSYTTCPIDSTLRAPDIFG